MGPIQQYFYPFFTSLGFRPKFSGGRGLLLRSNRPLHPVRHQDQLLRRRQQPRHRQDRIRRQGSSNWNQREMKQCMASPFVNSGTDGCLPLNNSMYAMYTTTTLGAAVSGVKHANFMTTPGGASRLGQCRFRFSHFNPNAIFFLKYVETLF